MLSYTMFVLNVIIIGMLSPFVAADLKEDIVKACSVTATQAATIQRYAAPLWNNHPVDDFVIDDVKYKEISDLSGILDIFPGAAETNFGDIVTNNGLISKDPTDIYRSLVEELTDLERTESPSNTQEMFLEKSDEFLSNVSLEEAAECTRDLDHFLTPISQAFKCALVVFIKSKIRLPIRPTRPDNAIEPWALRCKCDIDQWNWTVFLRHFHHHLHWKLSKRRCRQS